MDDVFTIEFANPVNIGTLALIRGETTVTEVEVSTGNSDDHSQNRVAITTTNDMVAPVFDEAISYVTIKVLASCGSNFSLREVLAYSDIHIGGYPLYGTSFSTGGYTVVGDMDNLTTEYYSSSTSPTVVEQRYYVTPFEPRFEVHFSTPKYVSWMIAINHSGDIYDL